MGAHPSRCRAENAELLSILYDVNKLPVTTVYLRDSKKFLMKRLSKLMDAIDNRVEEAALYRSEKQE